MPSRPPFAPSRRGRLAALAAGLLASLALPAAASARAPVFPELAVAGTTARGTFSGTLAVSRFALTPTGIGVRGALRGTLRDRRYPFAVAVTVPRFGLPAGFTPASPTDCAQLAITTAELRRSVFGLRVTFAARTTVLAPRRGAPRTYAQALCGATQALASGSATVLVDALTQLRAVFPS
jgi:hypothetical protein